MVSEKKFSPTQVSSWAKANPPTTSQEGIIGVDIPLEPTRSHEKGRAHGKSKAPSTNALESLMTTIEIVLSAT